MERADHVLMLTGDFGWSDVGGWDAMNALILLMKMGI